MDPHDPLSIAHVAHEMRVPLSLINGSLDALEQYASALLRFVRTSQPDRLSLDPAAAKDTQHLAYATEHMPDVLEICREGARRLTYVVEQLRTFGRRATDDPPQRVDLAQVVAHSLRAVRTVAKRAVTVHVKVVDPLEVMGSVGALGQVFINLIQNAFDATADSTDPTLWIEGRLLPRRPPAAEGEARSSPPRVEITIRDNGPGIPETIRARIFEPFFTTKPAHVGLGLGLAIVRQIVDQHGGSIAIRGADTGGGTTLILSFGAAVGQEDLTNSQAPSRPVRALPIEADLR